MRVDGSRQSASKAVAQHKNDKLHTVPHPSHRLLQHRHVRLLSSWVGIRKCVQIYADCKDSKRTKRLMTACSDSGRWPVPVCRSLPSGQSWSAAAVCLPNICHSSVDSCTEATCLPRSAIVFQSHCVRFKATWTTKLQIRSPEDHNKAYHNSKNLVRVRVPPVFENLCLLCDVQGHCDSNANTREEE